MSVEALNYARRVKVGNSTAKFVLTRLADRADERFSCFPSVELIAAEVEVNGRTIQRALALLRELRLVSDRAAYRADGSQTTSRYYLHGPWDQYGGTGVPFPEIVEPKQVRAQMWTAPPAEGDFREGTAAAVAVAGDKAEVEAAAERATKARARTSAAKEAQRARGQKAAAAKGIGKAGTDGEASPGIAAEGEGVTAMSPLPVTAMSPLPVTAMSPLPVTLTSPLEPSASTLTVEQNPGRSAGGQSAGGFARAGASSSAAPKDDSGQDGCAVDRKTPPTSKQRKATKVTEARPVAGEEDVWAALEPILAELGTDRGKRPPTLRKAVRQFLGRDTDARTSVFEIHPRRPEHALARLNHGWYGARGPERAAGGYDGPDRIHRPVGYLVTILTSPECVRPECERGRLLTTGEECAECDALAAERAVKAAADRLEAETTELATRSAARELEAADKHQEYGSGSDIAVVFGLPRQTSTWRCRTAACGLLGRGTPPPHQLCPDCEEDLRLSLQGTPARSDRPRETQIAR